MSSLGASTKLQLKLFQSVRRSHLCVDNVSLVDGVAVEKLKFARHRASIHYGQRTDNIFISGSLTKENQISLSIVLLNRQEVSIIFMPLMYLVIVPSKLYKTPIYNCIYMIKSKHEHS